MRPGEPREMLDASEMSALARRDPPPDPYCVDAAISGAIPKDSPLYKSCVGEIYPGVDPAIADATLAVMATLRSQQAIASEEANFAIVSADETRAARRDFGDMPIIMLTHAPRPAPKGIPQAMQDRRTMVWEQLHNEVAAMSTHGVNWIDPRSGHTINYDRPEIVIDAINLALAIAAGQGSQPNVSATK